MKAEIYLVVEPVALVAADLAECVIEQVPGARVLVAHDVEAALAQLDDATPVAVALVHADPSDFPATPLGGALAAAGARVVFIGNAAEHMARAAVPPPPVLDFPFSSGSVGAVLSGFHHEGEIGAQQV
jgi:hypothetical protein